MLIICNRPGRMLSKTLFKRWVGRASRAHDLVGDLTIISLSRFAVTRVNEAKLDEHSDSTGISGHAERRGGRDDSFGRSCEILLLKNSAKDEQRDCWLGQVIGKVFDVLTLESLLTNWKRSF